MHDDEDPQSDDDSSRTNPSGTSCPGTSATVSPDFLPLSQSSPSAASRTPSSQPCSLLPVEDTSPHVSPPGPEHSGPLTPTDWVCHAGFRTRPFRRLDGPKSVPAGNTRWYYTTAPSRLAAPPERSDLLERGDLFLHEDTRNNQFQAWIWDGVWARTEEGVPHPVFGGKRRLWFRFVKEEGRYEPNWIVKNSWNKYKGTRRQEIER
ncbi:hypothetical protein LXA43DRAFT_81703 [Ganoderma leucocontextum]|nr:hypothetical protein LXA43DRAFT_81703 [Ganoderma leucocontextum]